MKKLIWLLLLLVNSAQASWTLTTAAANWDTKANTLAAISTVQATWASTSYLGGTVHYYCDCGTGASGNCVAGSDSNNGTSTATPKQLLATAITDLNGSFSNQTIALCKGGAFNQTSASSTYVKHWDSCGAGLTCAELREFSPTTFSSTAKPIINQDAAGDDLLVFTNTGGNHYNGGLRILNLKLQGYNTGSPTGRAFQLFNGGADNDRDVTIANIDIDSFNLGFEDDGADSCCHVSNNIHFVGNNLTNIVAFGSLPAGGNNSETSYNSFVNVGGASLDHAIYLTGTQAITNYSIIGNYISGMFANGACNDAPIVGHSLITTLLVMNNYVYVPSAKATAGCWGIAFNNNRADAHPVGYIGAIFSGNTIINGGNKGLSISSCSNCSINNNLIELDFANAGGIGIDVATAAGRGGDGDTANTATQIINNTIWLSSSTTGNNAGITLENEGTGYAVENNMIYNAQSSGTFNCFNYTFALTSYAAINNNDCYSASAYNWELNHGATLAAWKTYATAYGFDSASFTGDPQFTAVGTNFTPAAGSPLIGAGNNTYKSTLDIIGVTRPNPPAIGAYEP